MDNENMNMAAAEDTSAQKEPPALVKKIGSMTYRANQKAGGNFDSNRTD